MADANHVNKLRGELEKVLDLIASNSAYRQQLLDDPRAALVAVGLDLESGEPEVAGYFCRPRGTCTSTCGTSCVKNPATCAGGTCTITTVQK